MICTTAFYFEIQWSCWLTLKLISTALCAVLDDQEWMISEPPVVVTRIDPLAEMDAEGIEHHVSEATQKAIARYLRG